jgi:hypothetical protein
LDRDADRKRLQLVCAGEEVVLKILGVLLVVFGLAALAYQGFTYTTSEKVVDLGPLEVQKEETKTVPLPPIVGGLALAGGVVLLIASKKA